MNKEITINGMVVYEDAYSKGENFMMIAKNGTNQDPGAEKTFNVDAKKETQESLMDKILKASNEIAKKSRSAYGEFIIASPEVCESLNDLAELERRKEKRKALNKKLNKIKNV